MQRNQEGRVLPWSVQLALLVLLSLLAVLDAFAGAITPLPGGSSGGAGTVTDVTGEDGITVNGVSGVPAFVSVTVTPTYGPAGDVSSVGATNGAGVLSRISRSDHQHQGVHSIVAGSHIAVSGAYGDVTVSTVGLTGNVSLTGIAGQIEINGVSGAQQVSDTFTISLTSTGVTAGTYGNAINIPQITVDGLGRLTVVSNVPVTIPSGNVTITGTSGDINVNGVSGSPQVGTTFNVSLVDVAVTPGTYGSATQAPVVTVDQKGRVTGASSATITHPTQNVSLTGAAGVTVNGTTSQVVGQTFTITPTYSSSATSPGLANSAGVADTASRGDHVHVAPSAGLLGIEVPTQILAFQSNAGLSRSYTANGAGWYVLTDNVISTPPLTTEAGTVGVSLSYTTPIAVAAGNLTLAASGVTPGSYGSATLVPVITFDTFGRATAASTAAITHPTQNVSITGANGITVNGVTTQQVGQTFTITPTYGVVGEVVSLATANAAGTTDKVARIDHAHASPFAGVNGATGFSTYSLIVNQGNGIAVTDAYATGTERITLTATAVSPLSSTSSGVSLSYSATDLAVSGGNLGLANTAVTPGSYTLTALTVDSKGRLTAASSAGLNAPLSLTSGNVSLAYDSGGLAVDTGRLTLTANVVFLTNTQTLTNKTLNDVSNFIDADSVHRKVFNNTGSTITKESAVYINGWDTTNSCPTIALATANSTTTMPALGLVEANIAPNSVGEVRVSGLLAGLDTSGLSANQALYVSPTTPGALTATEPTGTNLIQAIARVGRVNPGAGTVNIVGAGRSNAIPNFSGADKYWYGASDGTKTEGTITTLGRDLVDSATAADARAAIGVTTGVTVTAPGVAQTTNVLGLVVPANADASLSGSTVTITPRAMPSSMSGGYVGRVGTNLVLVPDTSRVMYILADSTGGVSATYIPPGGASVACTSLTNTATYYCYGYSTAGAATINCTTTSPVTDTRTGIWCKYDQTVNQTMTLLAWCYTDGTAAVRTAKYLNGSDESLTKQFLSNVYNKRRLTIQRLESTASWTYNSLTVTALNGSFNNRVEMIADGQSSVSVRHYGFSRSTPTGASIGIYSIAYDTNDTVYSTTITAFGGGVTALAQSALCLTPAAGYHWFQALQVCNSTTETVTYFGNTGGRQYSCIEITGDF